MVFIAVNPFENGVLCTRSVEVISMSRYSRVSNAQRVGLWLGRAYRGLVCQEQRIRVRLIGLGMPAAGAKGISFCLRLSALVLVFSVSALLALIVCGLWLIGRGFARSDLTWDNDHPTWRYGLFGFGLYDKCDMRIDPHDRGDS